MKFFPSRVTAARDILEIGRRMYESGFVAANDGNISCKIASDVVLATPTGVSKGFMDENMLVEMSTGGEILKKGELAPSSEIKMHLRVYKENPDVNAVTHAHPITATSFAIAGISLDEPILTETLMSLGSVPVAAYATPGTQEVPDSIAPFCRGYNAVMLANHGVLTWGESLIKAYYRLESVEYYAKIILNTVNIIGKAVRLSDEQIKPLMEIRKKLGVAGGGMPAYVAEAKNTAHVLPREGELQGVDLYNAIKNAVYKAREECCAGDDELTRFIFDEIIRTV